MFFYTTKLWNKCKSITFIAANAGFVIGTVYVAILIMG